MTPPLAESPWQAEHFSAKILAPSCGVPWPAGSPVPFGRIAMSHCWMSASESGRPSLGDSASAAPAPSTRRRATRHLVVAHVLLGEPAATSPEHALRVDMLDLPFAVDPPGRDAVVMLVGEGERCCDRRLGLAALRHELGAQWLRGASLVPGAAQDHGRLAVPPPRHDEAGERLWGHRPLQGGLTP